MVVPGRSRSITTRAGPSVRAADGPVEPLAREPGVVAVSAETRPVASVGAGSVMSAPETEGYGRCGVGIRADGRAGRRGAGGPAGPLRPAGCSRPAGCHVRPWGGAGAPATRGRSGERRGGHGGQYRVTPQCVEGR